MLVEFGSWKIVLVNFSVSSTVLVLSTFKKDVEVADNTTVLVTSFVTEINEVCGTIVMTVALVVRGIKIVEV